MNFTLSGFSIARVLGLVGTALVLAPGIASAQDAPLTDRLVGDVGGAAYVTQSVVRSQDTKTSLLPYGFVDYGRFFARVDTLGMKTVSLGYGYLELAGRVSQDGWRADTAALAGLTDRKASIPLGIGTFQKTPYGAFFLNAFVDANKSHGTLLDATYAAEFKLGSVAFYPQVGVEYRNAKYTNYFYGVSPTESVASGYAAYNAGASTTPMLGLAVDVPLAEPWVLSIQLRHKWLDAAVSDSPLVDKKAQNSGFVALAYRFK
jgi:outer membrane protein